MKRSLRILLWTALSGMIPLPVLSQTGYLPFDPEYLVALLFSLLLGTACTFAARWRPACVVLMTGLGGLGVSLYFGHALAQSVWLMGGAGICAAAFGWLAWRLPDKALLFAGTVSLCQITGMAFVTPGMDEQLVEKQVPRSDAPAVIHIILDEHAGFASIPEKAVSKLQVNGLIHQYVQRGFTVFTHAFSRDKHTELSLSRLANPNTDNIYRHLQHANNYKQHFILNASAFDDIAKERALDITQVHYVNFSPALTRIPSVSRNYIYNELVVREAASVYNINLYDRLAMAVYLSVAWLQSSASPPLLNRLLSTEPGRRFSERLVVGQRVYPLVSRLVMQRFTDRMACCGRRGTYYFIHLLLPHYPFALDSSCHARPLNSWMNNIISPGAQMMKERYHLYRLHFEQAKCVGSDVFRLVDNIVSQPELKDTVILVQSDHGSRIRLEDAAGKREGYTMADYERDWRGALLAIKMPGIPGHVVTTPVSVDGLYNRLLRSRFRTIDFNAPATQEDLRSSPY